MAGDTLTYAELVDLVELPVQRPVARSLLAVERAQSDLKIDPSNVLLKYYITFGQGCGVAWDKTKIWNVQMGISLLSAED